MSDVGVKVKKIIVEHLGVDEAKVTDEASLLMIQAQTVQTLQSQ